MVFYHKGVSGRIRFVKTTKTKNAKTTVEPLSVVVDDSVRPANELVGKLVELNEESQVKNTILHEIAHALVGPSHGHNAIWRKKAQEIGCDGNRCYSEKNTKVVSGKYKAICPHCQHVHHKYRKPKRRTSCGVCSCVFDENRLLIYE